MESKFAFNKLMFVEMDRRNILSNRHFNTPSAPARESLPLNHSVLSRFLSLGQPKTKGSVAKCLFGRPMEGETKRLEERMFQQERMRALNLYQFDVMTQQPVNLTPPASPYIGHQSVVSDREGDVGQRQRKEENTVIKEEGNKRISRKRSSPEEEEVGHIGHPQEECDDGSACKKMRHV